MTQTFSFCLIALALASSAARAQDEIVAVPNRPTVSTTAEPVQPGVLETEWGIDAASSHQDINDLFKFGLTSNFEFRLANTPITANSGTHGLGDTAVGFKYRLTRDSDHLPSISLMYMFKAPTAAAGSEQASLIIHSPSSPVRTWERIISTSIWPGTFWEAQREASSTTFSMLSPGVTPSAANGVQPRNYQV